MVEVDDPVEYVFFDIGGTLGERDAVTGSLRAFPDSARTLSDMRGAGLKIGIITTLGTLSDGDAWNLLSQAGLAPFLDRAGLVSEHDAGGSGKPQPAIYRAAASKVGVPIQRCLYIGENLAEVAGAMAAGMRALLKPSLT